MTATSTAKTIDELCVDTIRTLSMDAVQKANSGHPGTPMALAPVAYLLYTRILKHNPRNPDWPDRDRFVLSCGHASMLLYSTLYLAGYDITLEDIEQFRQLGSETPRGHSHVLHIAIILNPYARRWAKPTREILSRSITGATKKDDGRCT